MIERRIDEHTILLIDAPRPTPEQLAAMIPSCARDYGAGLAGSPQRLPANEMTCSATLQPAPATARGRAPFRRFFR